MKWLSEKGFSKIWNLSVSRKDFFKLLGTFFSILFLPGSGIFRKGLIKTGIRLKPRQRKNIITECDLAVVKSNDPEIATNKAIELLGGISRFVHPGDIVVVKPNIAWDRPPEQAANTNPKIVAAIVKLCINAGAKQVKVFDNTCNDPKRTYINSGIEESARKAGATVIYLNGWRFIPGEFPEGSLMKDWPILKDAVECDCFINVPIAKHHGFTQLSLSIKNLMGVCGGARGQMHQRIDKKLVEVLDFIKPDLTIIDAYRILVRNGPTGGNIKDVVIKNTIIAGKDPVLSDSYATTLFNLKPEDIGYIKLASEYGLGQIDISKANIKSTHL